MNHTNARRGFTQNISAVETYRSGANPTMSYKGHLPECWVNTQPIKRTASPSSVPTGHLPPHGEATNLNAPSPLAGEDARRVGEGFPQGFTLIELLVVVLIIGILAAVALPQYQKLITKTRLLEYENTFKLIEKAQQICKLRNDKICSLQELDIEIPSCTPLPGFFTSCNYQIGDDRIWLTSQGHKAFAYFPQSTTLQHQNSGVLYRETLKGFYCNAGDGAMDTAKCNKLGFSEFVIYGFFKRPN